MARTAADLPDELGSEFTLSDAIAAGVSPDRLRRRDLESSFRGVYRRLSPTPDHVIAGGRHEPLDWQTEHLRKARAFSTLMRDKQWFFCGITAALIWRLPVPNDERTDLEVAVHAPLRPPKRRGIRGFQVRPALADVRELAITRVTTPSSTWAILGSRCGLHDLVAVGDAVVRRERIPRTARLQQPPLATLEDLRFEIDRGRRTGLSRLRQATELIRTGSASAPETHMRLLLTQAGLPEPTLDFDVYDGRGRFLGCSEIAYPGQRTAFEYESEHHRVDRQQWNRDIEKYQDYADAGWRVIRVTSHLLYREPDLLVRQAKHALGRRAAV